MPRTARRVVWGRLLVIATLAPTSAFISVDFPTLGRPAKQAKPDRNAGTVAADGEPGPGDELTTTILPHRARHTVTALVIVVNPRERERNPRGRSAGGRSPRSWGERGAHSAIRRPSSSMRRRMEDDGRRAEIAYGGNVLRVRLDRVAYHC